jgi:TRAP-type mannitol/chloroaromatic compound transport system permease small subunit
MIDLVPALVRPLGDGFTILGFALAPFLVLPLLVLAFGKSVDEVAEPVVSLIDASSGAVEMVARCALLAMVLVVGTSVALRYVFGISLPALDDSGLYFHSIAFLLAMPLALLKDGHVRVDVFYAGLSARGKAWVDFNAYLFLAAPMLVTLLLLSGPYVVQSWSIAERSSEAGGLPLVWVIKTLIPVFAAALLAQCVAWGVRSARIIRGLDEVSAPSRSTAERLG